MVVQCKKLPSAKAMFIERSKFREQFLKKSHPWNNPAKSFQNLFFDGAKFCEQFLKRVTQGTSLSNYFKIRPGVSEKKIF